MPLIQKSMGVEFWKCLQCEKVRRVTSKNIDQIFLVEPDFCSTRCKRAYTRRHNYQPQGQLALFVEEEAV